MFQIDRFHLSNGCIAFFPKSKRTGRVDLGSIDNNKEDDNKENEDEDEEDDDI